MDERPDAGADPEDVGYEGSAAGGSGGPEAEGVLTVVCLKCGTEYYFGDEFPPEDLACEKCGNTVFRSFYSPEAEDEAAADFSETTERDLRPDDPEGATMPGDILDLDPERR